MQASFNVVQILRVTPDWGPPEFVELHKKHAGLSEIRFFPFGHSALWKFRAVGIYRPDVREFVLLNACKKSLGVYWPVNAFDLAVEYKQKLEAGKGTLVEHA